MELTGTAPYAVGNVLKCTSTNWAGSSTISYAFVNSQNGQVLQQGGGPPPYHAKPADAHATVYCSAIASNDGGVAMVRTTPLGWAPARH